MSQMPRKISCPTDCTLLRAYVAPTVLTVVANITIACAFETMVPPSPLTSVLQIFISPVIDVVRM